MKIKDPTEKSKLLALNISLILVFAVFIAGGYWFAGVDFAKGTLLGCFVVAINFFLSQRLVGQLLIEKTLKPALLIAYLFKFGLSGLILFLAITRWKIDIPGIMLGLSSVLIATVLSVFARKPEQPADE